MQQDHDDVQGQLEQMKSLQDAKDSQIKELEVCTREVATFFAHTTLLTSF